jgi:hypothetical protein
VFLALVLAACASPGARLALDRAQRVQLRALITDALPDGVADRAGWVADIESGFGALSIAPSHQKVCAVVAVIEQESGFRVDPVIPHLGTISLREIDRRASHAGIPLVLVHAALDLRSPDGRSYRERIESAKTERQLSEIYEDFIGQVPLGRRLFASWNPIRTRGPMQVNVAFAQQLEAMRPYPYHDPQRGLRDELFTRRASLYFGIAHLLDYRAPYDSYLYRFADYNAGQYASRNAAFQRAAAIVARRPLAADGALVPGGPDSGRVGATERLLLSLAPRLHLSPAQIRSALERERSAGFEHTALYRRVFALADRQSGRRLPRAVLPRIRLRGPKIEQRLTTAWYARRVYGRFESCLRR